MDLLSVLAPKTDLLSSSLHLELLKDSISISVTGDGSAIDTFLGC